MVGRWLVVLIKPTEINYHKDHTCSEHWSKGFRDKNEDFPNAIVPYSQILKMEQKREKFLKAMSKSKDPAPLKKSLKNIFEFIIADSSKIKHPKARHTLLAGSFKNQ